MKDTKGAITTGLLAAVSYAKDNRLLPHGFDKSSVNPDIAVHGEALADPEFTGAGHKLRYSIAVSNTAGPLTFEAELWHEPIGYRWENNLNAYDGVEPKRFTRYYDEMSNGAATLLARVTSSAGR